jgi:predicted RNase H-like nuclease (RuvC/YqgF family)
LTIFGVDIASGSPQSRHPPSYSLFILSGEETRGYPMISRHKLIRLIREMRPEIVAVDNVHELASGREMVSLLRRLPSSIKLVQVTGGDRPEPLAKVARWHGIVFDRLNPLEEAEACARLAAKGVGHVLSAFEDRTWIKVSRRRSPGRGGWSQNRYSRKIHGAVKGLAREVERHLRESGLEFTSRAVEGLGGYTRAEFMVEAPREKVHVNTGYYCDAQLRIQGVERPRLQFQPLQQRRGYIIVGIDPGTTTGIAVLSLRGELIDLISSRTISSSQVTEWIAARGRPLVVATDVFPTPGAVEKIKGSFNAVLYSPGMDVPSEEKIALARDFGYKNDHERDALAAAVSAFKRYRNKFQQVEKRTPAELNPDEVKALVVRGSSIEEAISELLAPAAEEKDSKEERALVLPPSPEASERIQLAEQVKTLRSYVEELKAELAQKDEAQSRINLKLERLRDREAREIKRDHEVRIREKEIERLRGLLRSERRYAKRLKRELSWKRKAERIELEGYRRLKVVEAFSKEAILEAAGRELEKGDAVLLKDASGGGRNTADLLVQRGVDAIIGGSDMSPDVREYLADKGVPVFSNNEITVHWIDKIAFINPQEVQSVKASWAEAMRARQAERQVEWLESMIAQYRVERRREQKREEKGWRAKT